MTAASDSPLNFFGYDLLIQKSTLSNVFDQELENYLTFWHYDTENLTHNKTEIFTKDHAENDTDIFIFLLMGH